MKFYKWLLWEFVKLEKCCFLAGAGFKILDSPG